jgi:hypothetical protein
MRDVGKFLAATFRANSNYRLVVFDRLPAHEQESLRHWTQQSDFYGVLRSTGKANLGLKAVDRDTALLFLTLQEPGKLPGYTLLRPETDDYQDLAELVFEGVLEVELDGRFVSGPEASSVLCRTELSVQQGKVAQLSLRALQYGQYAETDDPLKLWPGLYLYGSRPLTPAWKKEFSDAAAVASYLGLGPRGQIASLLESHWVLVEASPPQNPWNIFLPRHSLQNSGNSHSKYKLYVSPACEHLRETFFLTVRTLADRAPARFKVGGQAHGLLRPDKIVIYFSSMEDLQDVARLLEQTLRGCPAQGVPFTAEISGDGLLSWGIDPPASINWGEPGLLQSWRSWITKKLATSLIAAKRSGASTLEPWEFALHRLQMEGVETRSWTPPETSWRKLA